VADGDGCFLTAATDRNRMDPGLAGYDSGAGRTGAFLLNARSQARGNGVDCPAADQGGIARPRQGCDAGAVQFHPRR
jgi:hypothetical protein